MKLNVRNSEFADQSNIQLKVMTWVRYITQLCFSSNLAGIMANKIEQSFYSVYSYSGIESIEHTLNVFKAFKYSKGGNDETR